jgi:hypothetical protein
MAKWYTGYTGQTMPPLGHEIIRAQPDLYSSQLEHGEIVCGSLFVERGDSSEVFDAIEEALDPVALSVGCCQLNEGRSQLIV